MSTDLVREVQAADAQATASRREAVPIATAISEAIAGEMEHDERVFLMGEEVGLFGGAAGHLQGLYDRFGPERIRDTPITEAGFIGAASGAAVAGMRPIAELMVIDFFGVAMDQIVNYMAKVHYGSAGERKVPMVLLASTGNPLRQGSNHSQTLHGLFAHLPGMKVVAPSTAYDTKGMLAAAIRDDNPVLFLYHRSLMRATTLPAEAPREVPAEPYALPLGECEVKRPGADVTIVTVSLMVHHAMRAAVVLQEEGIEAEVIDLRTVSPLDRDTIVASVEKTGRLVVVDEDYQSFGMTGEVITTVCERAMGALKAPPRRLARPDIPVPYSRVLEDHIVPNAAAITDLVRDVVGPSRA